MKKSRILPLLALAVLAHGARAATLIGDGHADIGIGYKGGAFDLHIHQEEPTETEYEPDEAVFLVGPGAALTSPGGAFSFLGAAGSTAWVLGTSPVAGLPFIGWGTEELESAEWLGSISLSLTAVNGPGAFSVWEIGAFGTPTVKMSSADGIGASDTLQLLPGSHAHYFIGFTQPGLYEVSLQASGTHATDGPILSGASTYSFQVVPEPSTWALLGLGAGALLFAARRRS